MGGRLQAKHPHQDSPSGSAARLLLPCSDRPAQCNTAEGRRHRRPPGQHPRCGQRTAGPGLRPGCRPRPMPVIRRSRGITADRRHREPARDGSAAAPELGSGRAQAMAAHASDHAGTIAAAGRGQRRRGWQAEIAPETDQWLLPVAAAGSCSIHSECDRSLWAQTASVLFCPVLCLASWAVHPG